MPCWLKLILYSFADGTVQFDIETSSVMEGVGTLVCVTLSSNAEILTNDLVVNVDTSAGTYHNRYYPLKKL